MRKLNQLLHRRRIELSLSQDAVAFELGIHLQTISNYERDITYPPYKYIDKLAKILQINQSEIEDAVMIDHRDKVRKYFKTE